MDQEAIQSQASTSSSSGKKDSINFNRQTGSRISTSGLVVTVEGIPRRPSAASSTSTSTKMKIARRLSNVGVPNQLQQQNQQASSTSSTVNTLRNK